MQNHFGGDSVALGMNPCPPHLLGSRSPSLKPLQRQLGIHQNSGPNNSGRNYILNLNYSAELRSCVKVEVAVLGSPTLISLMVSVDVKQLETRR